MQNLDQIRAAAALEAAAQITRQVVSKLPAMILQNGLLPTAAFASEEKDDGTPKRPEMMAAFKTIGKHLVDREIVGDEVRSVRALIHDLSQNKPINLQRATTEALALLSFLKRFATKEEDIAAPTD
jgi:CRISPR type III-B/RAMP module-associated protein Cmr5